MWKLYLGAAYILAASTALLQAYGVDLPSNFNNLLALGKLCCVLLIGGIIVFAVLIPASEGQIFGPRESSDYNTKQSFIANHKVLHRTAYLLHYISLAVFFVLLVAPETHNYVTTATLTFLGTALIAVVYQTNFARKYTQIVASTISGK